MNLSTKARYAIMAMTDIAYQMANSNQSVVGLAAIAERQDISLAYLEQIFVKLRRADLVTSIRGPGGGYSLTNTPENIFLSHIILAVDEPVNMTRCQGDEKKKGGCASGEKCLTHGLWVSMGQHLLSFFENITLSDVINGNYRCKSAFLAADLISNQSSSDQGRIAS